MDLIEKRCIGFEIYNIEVNSLFFADDGLIFAYNIREAERNIEIVKETSLIYGPEHNIEKKNTIIFNKKEEISVISGIKVVEEIKYLGINIINKRNAFYKHIENKITKAKRLEKPSV